MINRPMVIALVLLGIVVTASTAAETTLIVKDPDGAAGRVGAPVSIAVDLKKVFGEEVDFQRLRLAEQTGKGEARSVPVQFMPDAEGATSGMLWWLMPPGPKGERRFQLTVAAEPTTAALGTRYDQKRELVDVAEGDLPVLRYNHGTVPPPPEIMAKFERGREHPLYYARGDYIHPLFGPDGEQITDDYSLNHPHHRGVFWSWPVLRWKGEVRDIWAVRVLASQPGGAWARPVAMRRVGAGPVLAVIDAENVWKWGDEDPIVGEDVLIRAFRSCRRSRVVDVQVRLQGLVDDVSIGGRPGPGYGGFAVRTFPTFPNRKIVMHIDPPQAKPRKAWLHLTGDFPGGKGPAGMVLFEHVANPSYPNYPNTEKLDRIPDEYPKWRCVLPCFPGSREVALPKDKPLVLRYRLWIHPGVSDEATVADMWACYAQPRAVRFAK